MNFSVLLIIVLAVLLVAFLVLPRFKGVVRSEKTTVDRRSGGERRRRKVRVPIERRRRNRRAEDAAKAFVDNLSS